MCIGMLISVRSLLPALNTSISYIVSMHGDYGDSDTCKFQYLVRQLYRISLTKALNLCEF